MKMLEKALVGSRKYWAWVIFLLAVFGVGFIAYLYQFQNGLGITGLSRDVSWGSTLVNLPFWSVLRHRQ